MQLRVSPVFICVSMACLVVLARPGWATPGQTLAEARTAFELGKYEDAVPLLSYLLYPTAQLSSSTDLREAHLLLGLCHLELGNRVEAQREVEEALFLDSNLTLDPLVFSEAAIVFVEERKREITERAERDAEALVEARARDRARELLENTIVIERRPYFINFVPFGAGQFQNGHRNKGILLSISQVVLGGASIGLFAYQVGQYGFNGVVPQEDAAFVRQLQGAQIITGSLCLALMAYGVVDSLIYYESTTRVPADESLLPDELKEGGQEPGSKIKNGDADKAKKSSFRIAPLVGPRSGSLVMSWEF